MKFGLVFTKFLGAIITIFFFNGQYIFLKTFNYEVIGKTNIFEYKNYVLGAGDRISIKIFDLEQYDSEVIILPDGTVNLPRLGLLKIKGLRINQAQELISKAYKKIIKNPIIYINLLEARPTRVTISGEVSNPGFYIMDNQNNESTIVEALKKAGGLSDLADIRKIILKRYDHSSNALDTKTFNFWAMLNGETLSIDPIIYDGDIIHVEKIENQSLFDLRSFNKTNLSKQNIDINLLGEINSPGIIQIESNSTLNDAIIAAGGLTRYANRRKISLFRLLDNGKISERVFSFNLKEPFNSSENPMLRNKDVIFIKPNFLAKTERTISDVTKPLNPVVNTLSIYKLLTD